jgi:hypothetical protein
MPRKQSDALVLASIAKGHPGLTLEKAAALVQAAAVCLHENGHRSGVALKVVASPPSAHALEFDAPTAKAKRAHDDLQEATEDGAMAVAIAVVTRVTKHRVVLRSRKGTGFDWWLGPRAGVFEARLEVSGILHGPGEVNGRVKDKLKQMTPTDAGGLPGYAAVIEFGTPQAAIVEKP